MTLEDDGLNAKVDQVVKALTGRGKHYGLPHEVIERTVRDSLAEFDDARIKDFVSLFAERSAGERLRRLNMGSAGAAS